MKKLLKKLANNLAYTLIGVTLAISGGVVLAINVTVPQSAVQGSLPIGNSNGSYTNGNLVAGSNITITTSTPGQITITAANGASGAVANGINGYVTRYTGTSTISTGILIDNASVAGVNATSSGSSFNIQGTAALNPFRVASSTGTALLTVGPNGSTTIASLGTGLVRSSSGSLFIDPSTYLTAALTSLNGQTGSTQTFGTSSSGSTFSITSSGNIHTFNIPANLLSTTTAAATYQPTGNYLTALTGDVSSSGPGSATATLATVNGNVGSFTYGSFTVNGKGLITAASSGAAPVTTVSTTSAGSLFNALISGNNIALTFPANLLSTTTAAATYLTNVTGSGNIASSGGLTPNITFTGVLPIANGGTATTTPTLIAGANITVTGTWPFQTITGSAGGSGNSAWTIGPSSIYNATSTDLVGIGTSAPTTTLFVQGKGGTNPFAIASSTGTQLVTVRQNGNVGIGTTTPAQSLVSTGSAQFGTANSDGVFLGSPSMGLQGNNFGQQLYVFMGAGSGTAGGNNAALGFFTNNGGDLKAELDSSGNFQIDGVLRGSGTGAHYALGTLGVGTTTATSGLTVQATSAVNPFTVASTTGISMFTISPNGSTTITSLGNGVVRSNSGALFNGLASLTADVSGILPIANGGTATSTAPADNALFVGNGTAFFQSVLPSCSNSSTSKLLYNSTTRVFTCGTDQTGGGGGSTTTITSDIQADGPNFTFATGTMTGLNLNITGSGSTVTFSPQLQSGYSIPLTASTTEWSGFYNAPSTRITAGTNLSWSGNTLNATGGSGSSAFTIGPSIIYNATSTDLVGIGTITPTSTLFVQGKGGVNPFTISSSTGTSIFSVSQTGTTTVKNLNISSLVDSGPRCLNIDSNLVGMMTSNCLSVSGAASTVGYSPYWTDLLGTLSTAGPLINNGTVVGVNASSSTASFNIRGTTTLDPFRVASSTGTNILVATVDSRVGIGTSSPQKTLHVWGTDTGGPFRVTRDTTNNILANSFYGTADFVAHTPSTTLTAYPNFTGPVITFSMSSSTNLSSPTVLGDLAVARTATDRNGQMLLRPYLNGTPQNGITTIANSYGQDTAINTSTAYATLYVQAGAGRNPFTIASSTGTNLLTMLPNGNVGIGSSTPVAPLSVAGGIAATGNYHAFGGQQITDTFYCNSATKCMYYADTDNTNAGVNFEIQNTNSGANAYAFLTIGNNLLNSSGTYYSGIGMNSSGYSNPVFGTGLGIANQLAMQTNIGPISIVSATTTNGYINFLVGTGDTGSEVMRLIPGRVGIGTTSPISTLSVMGTSSAPTIAVFNVASSSGTSLFQVTAGSQILACTTCRLTIPQGANPTLSGIGDIAFDTTEGQFLVNASSTGSDPLVLASTTIRSITWESPTASDNISFFRANRDMTIVGADCIQTSGVNAPSHTINIRHFTNRSTTTANTLLSSNVACTATTTAQSLTINGDNTVATGEYVWVISSAVTNSSSTNINLYIKDDRK